MVAMLEESVMKMRWIGRPWEVAKRLWSNLRAMCSSFNFEKCQVSAMRQTVISQNGQTQLKTLLVKKATICTSLFHYRNFLAFFHDVQCLQSSLAQDGGGNHRQYCITDLPKALKTLIKMSQELPEIFEILLRPSWWAAGNEQPSPPLHRAAAARLLRYFDKYKSLYTRNMIANRFVVYNDLYLSKHLSSRAAAAR